MSTDANKKNTIVWKRSNQTQQTDATGQDPLVANATTIQNSPDNSIGKEQIDIDISPLDIARRAGDNSLEKSNSEMTQSIEDLRAEIEREFGGKKDPSAITTQSRSDNVINLDADINESTKEVDSLLPITPKAHKTEPSKNDFMPPAPLGNDTEAKTISEKDSPIESIDESASQNHENILASIKADINSEFDVVSGEKKIKEQEPEISSKTGVGQTYYSDLSTAMGANEPTTMSELIKKSRFEKKEAAILSPKSKRNLMFIFGAIILLITSFVIIYSIFARDKETIEFTSEERVSSFVFANQDTGINVTNLESERTKQAIRKVLEQNIPEDTINQIYYVEQTSNNSIRRLGVKDIFDKTDNQTPPLLYDNISNEFTHGVYASDRNYPFIMLKALSYDRALEGMKDWEPTMLDDLATYFDLPPEATDRSLIKDGFEDDLIRNKNVRVSRYLPREVDGRGILDFLRFNSSSDTVQNPDQETEDSQAINPDTSIPSNINTNTGVEVDEDGNIVDEPADNVVALLFKKIAKFTASSFSQNTALAQSPAVTGVSFGTINNQNSSDGQRICYAIEKKCIDQLTGAEVPFQEGNNNQLCTDTRLNNITLPSTPAREADLLNFSCINILSGGDAISQVSDRAPICFRNDTGARLQTADASQFCFESYRCNRLACTLNGAEVPSSQEGQPGVTCGQETSDLISFDSPLPKICREFTDILSYENINQSPVCFDNRSNYLRYKTPNDPRLGFNCIMPQNRTNRLCVTNDEKVVVRTGTQIFSTDQFCFQPNLDGATNIGVNNQCSNLTVDQIQSRLALGVLQLRLAAGIGSVFGLSNQDVDNINNAASYIGELSQGNILQVESARQTSLVLQTLEQVLDQIDPNIQLPQSGPNGGLNLYGVLRETIDAVKCTLGIANTLQWSTLAQLPQGFTIYAGQSLEGVESAQQALALIGLMDSISTNGTLDLVTQDAISQFQLANGLMATGILGPETIDVLNNIINNQGTLLGGNEAIVNDYLPLPNETLIALGSYNDTVEDLQIILFVEGYEISTINGLFDEQTCKAVQQFQIDNELDPVDPVACELDADTISTLNDIIRTEGYLGSGFGLNPQGFLQGIGKLEGSFGPGVANFEVNQADADTLREGDIVLMYMFLDEETILIARDQVVIDEIIKRRVLSDIFNK